MNVSLSIDGGIGTMVLNNPPHNALTSPAFVDRERLAAVLADPGLKAMLVSGAGRHFCAGADLEVLRGQTAHLDSLRADLDAGKQILEMLRSAPVPVIAVVRGSCLGAGMEIALACHFRIVASTAMLGFPECELGLMPGFGGTLGQHAGVAGSRIAEMVLSGRMVNGEEAAAMGLATRCVPVGRLEEEAIAFMRSLIDGRSPRLIHNVMTSIHNAWRLPRSEALAEETKLFCDLVRSADSGGLEP